jgi:hypothetical protein
VLDAVAYIRNVTPVVLFAKEPAGKVSVVVVEVVLVVNEVMLAT